MLMLKMPTGSVLYRVFLASGRTSTATFIRIETPSFNGPRPLTGVPLHMNGSVRIEAMRALALRHVLS